MRKKISTVTVLLLIVTGVLYAKVQGINIYLSQREAAPYFRYRFNESEEWKYTEDNQVYVQLEDSVEHTIYVESSFDEQTWSEPAVMNIPVLNPEAEVPVNEEPEKETEVEEKIIGAEETAPIEPEPSRPDSAYQEVIKEPEVKAQEPEAESEEPIVGLEPIKKAELTQGNTEPVTEQAVLIEKGSEEKGFEEKVSVEREAEEKVTGKAPVGLKFYLQQPDGAKDVSYRYRFDEEVLWTESEESQIYAELDPTVGHTIYVQSSFDRENWSDVSELYVPAASQSEIEKSSESKNSESQESTEEEKPVRTESRPVGLKFYLQQPDGAENVKYRYRFDEEKIWTETEENQIYAELDPAVSHTIYVQSSFNDGMWSEVSELHVSAGQEEKKAEVKEEETQVTETVPAQTETVSTQTEVVSEPEPETDVSASLMTVGELDSSAQVRVTKEQQKADKARTEYEERRATAVAKQKEAEAKVAEAEARKIEAEKRRIAAEAEAEAKKREIEAERAARQAEAEARRAEQEALRTIRKRTIEAQRKAERMQRYSEFGVNASPYALHFAWSRGRKAISRYGFGLGVDYSYKIGPVKIGAEVQFYDYLFHTTVYKHFNYLDLFVKGKVGFPIVLSEKMMMIPTAEGGGVFSILDGEKHIFGVVGLDLGFRYELNRNAGLRFGVEGLYKFQKDAKSVIMHVKIGCSWKFGGRK